MRAVSKIVRIPIDYCHLRDGERARQGRPSLVFGDSALTFYGATARII